MSLVPIQPVSGQTLIQASGAAVTISGNIISVSGTVTIAGAVKTSVSGNQVYLGSGSNYVFISGTPAVSVSGNVISISGTATIAGAVTTNVSGNTTLNVPAWYGATDVSGWFLKVSG